jgi:hypothetical protein
MFIVVDLLLPVVVPYVAYGRQHSFGHSAFLGVALVDDVLRPTPWQMVWSRHQWLPGYFNTAMFPGIVAMSLAVTACILGRADVGLRRTVWALTLLCTLTFLLSLGPYLKIADDPVTRLGDHAMPAPGAIFRYSPRSAFRCRLPCLAVCSVRSSVA